MLSNTEIQAIITATGVGIGDEFDIEKLRYHRVIVMTDADVDGSHIRTLILTFLYRQMPELIENGHVYIAAAPLYKVKLGNQEFYFEKDAQLEDLLARERIPQVKVDRPRRQRGQVDGDALAAVHEGVRPVRRVLGPPARRLRDSRRGADGQAPPRRASDRVRRPGRGRDRGDRAERVRALDRRHRTTSGFQIQVVETETSTARTITVPVELLGSPIYGHVRRAYARLTELVGLPPFTVTVGKEPEVAETFDALRTKVLDAAKTGIQLSRFKGLGEMNAEQLWDTTMDPARRLLIRVDVEDVPAADRVFSMLMGDQVEPRRAVHRGEREGREVP